MGESSGTALDGLLEALKAVPVSLILVGGLVTTLTGNIPLAAGHSWPRSAYLPEDISVIREREERLKMDSQVGQMEYVGQLESMDSPASAPLPQGNAYEEDESYQRAARDYEGDDDFYPPNIEELEQKLLQQVGEYYNLLYAVLWTSIVNVVSFSLGGGHKGARFRSQSVARLCTHSYSGGCWRCYRQQLEVCSLLTLFSQILTFANLLQNTDGQFLKCVQTGKS